MHPALHCIRLVCLFWTWKSHERIPLHGPSWRFMASNLKGEGKGERYHGGKDIILLGTIVQLYDFFMIVRFGMSHTCPPWQCRWLLVNELLMFAALVPEILRLVL